MVQRIQAPNGDILEFPDDMSEDAMLGVMHREYGGPATQPAQAGAPAAQAGAPAAGGSAPGGAAGGPATAVPGGGASPPAAPAVHPRQSAVVNSNSPSEMEAFGKQLSMLPPVGGGTMQDRVGYMAGQQRAAASDAADATKRRDNAPWYSQVASAATDIGKLVGDGAFMGYGDKALAALKSGLTDESYDSALARARARTDEAKKYAGWAGTGAQVAGALAGPGGTILGPTEKAVGTIGNWGARQLARLGVGATTGTAYGALDASGHDTDVAEGARNGGIFGGLAGVAGPAIAKGAGKVVGMFTDLKNAVPTLDTMRNIKNTAYDAVEQSPTRFSPQDVALTVRNARNAAEAADIHPQLHKQATAKLNQMDDQVARHAPNPGGNGVPPRPATDMTPKQLDQMRQNIFRDVQGNEGEQFMAGVLGRNVDALLDGSPAGPVVRNAREANRQYKVFEDVTKRDYSAGNAAAAPRDAIPAKMRSILYKGGEGINAAERAAMENVVQGSTVGNIAKGVNKIVPGGLVSSGVAGGSAAYYTGNPVVGALVAAGSPIVKGIAGKVADREAAKGVENVLRTISGVPSRVKSQARLSVEGPLSRDRLRKLLMTGYETGNN